MSKITYLHEVKNQLLVNGKKRVHEEYIIDGPKGITIKYFYKEENKDTNIMEKILITGKDNEFIMKTIVQDKKEEMKLNKSELLNELNKNKKLKFANEFALTQKGGVLLGRIVIKRTSRNIKTKRTSKK